MGGILQTLLNDRIAVDERTNSVIIHGSQENAIVAEAIALRLDAEASPKASRQMLVRVLWLVGGSGEALTRLDSPPKDLDTVVQELAKLGIINLRLAAQTIINASTVQPLDVHGSLVLPIPWANRLSVTGTLSDAAGGMPSLQVAIGVHHESPERGSVQLCNIATQITTPPGHFVVLGVTPTESLTSVFVVQVTPTETNKPESQPAPVRGVPKPQRASPGE
jgi:hypothetical protein